MFDELKVFSNEKKCYFLEEFKTRLEAFNEDDQLKELNNLFKFDKDNSPFLTNDTHIDNENLLVEFHTIIYNNTDNIISIILCTTFLIGKRDSIKSEFKLEIYERLTC